MRFLLKAEMATDKANKAICDGSLPKIFQSIIDDLKPEASYFLADNGGRTVILILDMKDASQIPSIAEPWFQALNARIELVPVMSLDDIKKAGPAIEQACKKYA
jgi:hypothetical protein